MSKKQHNLEPIERARNAGWQAAYHMILTDPEWDDKAFKANSLGTVYSKAEQDAYESAKRAYLTQQQ